MDSVTNAELKEIRSSYMQKAAEIVNEIHITWDKIGFQGSRRVERATRLWTSVLSVLEGIQSQENNILKDKDESVTELLRTSSQLATELGTSVCQVSGPLIEQEKLLRKEIETLTKMKAERLKQLHELKDEQKYLCNILNVKSSLCYVGSSVPSDTYLQSLKTEIENLKAEKENREQRITEIINELQLLSGETGMNFDFPQDQNKPSLSIKSINHMQGVLEEARKKKIELKTLKEKLIRKVNSSWIKLGIEEQLRNESLSKYEGFSTSVLKSIESEIALTEELYKERIRNEIPKFKNKLAELWDLCEVPEDIRHAFSRGTAHNNLEEDYEELKAEVTRLNLLLLRKNSIIGKISSRMDLWNRWVELEKRSRDTKRFSNRKGSLLQEEKDRKKLQKSLGSIDKEISENIAKFEADFFTTFRYQGKDYGTLLAQQLEELNKTKENSRVSRGSHNGPSISGIPVRTARKPIQRSKSTDYLARRF